MPTQFRVTLKHITGFNTYGVTAKDADQAARIAKLRFKGQYPPKRGRVVAIVNYCPADEYEALPKL